MGLVLNATLGWSWADPIAALVIAAIAVKEGRDAWQGKGCCATPATAAVAPSADSATDACGLRPRLRLLFLNPCDASYAGRGECDDRACVRHGSGAQERT